MQAFNKSNNIDPVLFKFTFSGESNEFFERLSKLISRQNGTIVGSVDGGSFSLNIPELGIINGFFAIVNHTCTITIDNYPSQVSWDSITRIIKLLILEATE